MNAYSTLVQPAAIKQGNAKYLSMQVEYELHELGVDRAKSLPYSRCAEM